MIISRSGWRQFRREGGLDYLGMLAPILIFLVVIALSPLVFSFLISLYKYRLTDPDQVRTFVGLQNYVNAIQDPRVVGTLRNTFIFVAGAVVTEMLLGLGLALLLSAETRLMTSLRALLLVPMTLTPLVVGLIWKALLNADFGPFSYYLKAAGLQIGAGPLGDARWAMPFVILVDTWQWTPLLMVIFLAGLKSLPTEPYEAAFVDGASTWQRFWFITLPLLKPTLLIGLLLRTMQAFKVFDIIYGTTQGGPGSATTVLNYHIYTVGLTFFDMGYAAALANILLLFIAILSIFYILVLERQQA
jgi:multiple sugar transport system permease protein